MFRKFRFLILLLILATGGLDDTVIGAGSVVTRDVPPNSIAYGNPCKVAKANEKWSI